MKNKVVMTAFMLIIASSAVSAGSFDSAFESDFFSSDSSMDSEEWFSDDFFSDDGSEEDEGSQDESSNDEEESTDEEDFFSSDDWFSDDFFNDDETDTREDDSEREEERDEDAGTGEVTEEAYILEAPEEGEEWFEAGSDEWVSYVNPRDEYKREFASYQGEGSGKICITLLNEDEEVIAGETLPDTQVTVPTGESLDWHPHANPFTVDLPLTENYERPLDSDQFGTSPDMVQGDGYIDSHCIEWHDLAEDATIQYGEAEITGAHADEVEVVGYIQQPHEAWDTDVDPVEDAESYEEAGGGWTMHEEGSHGQAVVVLQLDR